MVIYVLHSEQGVIQWKRGIIDGLVFCQYVMGFLVDRCYPSWFCRWVSESRQSTNHLIFNCFFVYCQKGINGDKQKEIEKAVHYYQELIEKYGVAQGEQKWQEYLYQHSYEYAKEMNELTTRLSGIPGSVSDWAWSKRQRKEILERVAAYRNNGNGQSSDDENTDKKI